MNINKVLKKYYYTHMPFIYYDLDNMPNLLFTRMNDNFWKLCHFDGKKIQDINMNLNLQDGTYYHCQPTCRVTSDGIYHVSFCIQVNGEIYLYYSESTDILNLNPKLISKCSCGSVTEKYICISYLNQYLYILKNDNKLYEKLDNDDFFDDYIHNQSNLLYSIQLNVSDRFFSRINYIPGENDKLLLSWTASHTDKHGSILLDLVNLKGYDINTLDGGPVYKCAIDPIVEEIYFGKKIGSAFEERKIVKLPISEIKFTEISNKELIFNKL